MRVLGISDPESIVGKPVSAELPLLAPLAGEVVERLCSPGQLLQAGGNAVLHAFGHEHRVGAGERLPERYRLRARRRGRDDR